MYFMWRDPYGTGWGERLLGGLVALLVATVGIKLLATFVTPLIPMLFSAVVVAALMLWFFRRRY